MRKFMIQMRLPSPLSEEFYALVPEHRAYIDTLINDGIITLYAINEERTRGWTIVLAENAEEAMAVLEKSPIHAFLTCHVDELFIFDGETMRLPKVSLN